MTRTTTTRTTTTRTDDETRIMGSGSLRELPVLQKIAFGEGGVYVTDPVVPTFCAPKLTARGQKCVTAANTRYAHPVPESDPTRLFLFANPAQFHNPTRYAYPVPEFYPTRPLLFVNLAWGTRILGSGSLRELPM